VRLEFNGPINLDVLSPAGVHGHGVVPAGATAATLFVQASSDLPSGAYPLQVSGSAVIGGRVVRQPARIRAQIVAALAGLPYPPPSLLDTGAVAVTEKTPFDIQIKVDPGDFVRGKSIPVTIELAGGKPAENDIKLASVGLPAKVTAAIPVLSKGKTSVKGTISAAGDAPPGEHEFSVIATGASKGREFQSIAKPALVFLKAKAENVKATK
jgi:hypothetical protein